MPTIERNRSAERIERDIETLAGPDYTLTDEAIRRYAYTDVYRRTLDYFTRELESLGFEVSEDPVGTLVARNRPPGEPVFGIGSHCDSNRNGGKYDGTMGVVTALEVCRLNEELGQGLPLQLISFLEEEGSGFGQMLLGSRIIAQRVTEEELKDTFRAIDDGRSFWEHAEAAGYEPASWRVLQDTGNRIGIVNAIAGYIHADVRVSGRGDHAGATPMGLRLDPTLPLAETIVELERLAVAAGKGTVGTVGEIEVRPGIINAIASGLRFSLDIRGPDDEAYQGVARDIAAFAQEAAGRRGMSAEWTQRQALAATPMDARIVEALETAAAATGEPYVQMHSGAAHDTMCVADRVPTAMVFVPCKDGISHHPAEDADPADAAIAAEIILNAIRFLQ
jgi:acetylornithine deacetylase/succinyl-diaminopimelate desuccinylase-like protein